MSLPFSTRAEPRRNPPVTSRRPDLRVVDSPPRRTVGRVGTLAGAALFVALFALAAFQTVLIRTQARIDELDRRIAEQEQRQVDLRLELADRRAPERIVSVATERLGMIAPGTVAYLQPQPDDDARATYQPTPPVRGPEGRVTVAAEDG